MRSISITGVFDASDSSKPVLHRLHDRRQVRPRIEQPHLRFHRKRMDALLHDRGAFAVVLADDDQRAAGDAARGEVGQRVGGDVGADRGLEGHRAAQRIVHRSGEGGGGGRLARRVLEVDAEPFQDLVGVGQHVHQVRDRRALVARHIGHAGLQQRLGDGQDALAVELGAVAELQLFDLFLERAFRHFGLFGDPVNLGIRLYSMDRAAESARILGLGHNVALNRLFLQGDLSLSDSANRPILQRGEWLCGAAEKGRTRPTFDNSPTHGVSCRTSILLSARVHHVVFCSY